MNTLIKISLGMASLAIAGSALATTPDAPIQIDSIADCAQARGPVSTYMSGGAKVLEDPRIIAKPPQVLADPRIIAKPPQVAV